MEVALSKLLAGPALTTIRRPHDSSANPSIGLAQDGLSNRRHRVFQPLP
jgi:hypothetical protein